MDVTQDISRLEQMSICVRYVDISTNFLEFVVAENLTGEGLSKTIMQQIEKLGLEKQYLVGQGDKDIMGPQL